jgi:hypothetical protein
MCRLNIWPSNQPSSFSSNSLWVSISKTCFDLPPPTHSMIFL